MTVEQDQDKSEIWEQCNRAAKALYGDSLPEPVRQRMTEEINHIERNGFAPNYLLAAAFVDYAAREGQSVMLRGSGGSSLVAFLLGISEVNPLSPHYRCPDCLHSEWEVGGSLSGYDLPKKHCPRCGSVLAGDGHRIPYEMFFGLEGNTPPKFDFYVALEFEDQANREVQPLGNHDKFEQKGTIPRIFARHSLSVLNQLHHLTGVHPGTIPMNDPNVFAMLRSIDRQGDRREQTRFEVGTYGIPEMGVDKVRDILVVMQPSTFGELTQLFGLSHGTGTWTGQNTEIRPFIASRDQVMLDLMDKGMEREIAFAIADRVRRGNGVTVLQQDAMRRCNLPQGYVDSCQTIQYLFPKSCAVTYAMDALRHAYYKLHHPSQFQATSH